MIARRVRKNARFFESFRGFSVGDLRLSFGVAMWADLKEDSLLFKMRESLTPAFGVSLNHIIAGSCST